MLTISQINGQLDESLSLKYIAQAYSEISAVKLQKIRSGIEKNRNFFQEITGVFRMVKVAAAKRNIKLTGTKKKGNVSILLTSNHRFYGALEEKLIRYFIINTTKFKTDRIIIGKSAAEFLTAMRYSHPHNSVLFKEDLPDITELRNLIVNLMDYEQILVYYSRMQSVLLQEPHVVDVLQQPPEHYTETTHRGLDYIFEPELDKVLQFFNSQIATLLFEQTFLESELARTAARLISMNQAQGNAESLIKDQKMMLSQAKKSEDNNRLLNTVATLLSLRRRGYAG